MCKKLFVLLLLVAFTASTASAAYRMWDNDSTDQLWSTAANWQDDTLPDKDKDAAITGGIGVLADDVHVYIDETMVRDGENIGTAAVCKKLFISRNHVHDTIFGGTYENGWEAVATAPAIVTVDGGDLVVSNNQLRLGSRPGDFGILELISGSILVTNDHHINPEDDKYGDKELEIGEFGTGVFNMSGGTLAAKDIRVSYQNASAGIGHGYFNISGGTVTLFDDLEIAKNASWDGDVRNRAVGVMTMSGGTINVKKNVDIGDKGMATVFMSDGTINLNEESMRMARKENGIATFYMSGGTVDFADEDLSMAYGGTATLVMSGGSFLDIDDMSLGKQDDGTSQIANVVMTGGLIFINDQFRLSENAGPQAQVTLGDGEEDVGALGDATISTDVFKENADGDDWMDFQPGGLLLIREGDKTGDMQALIDASVFLTTYNYGDGADWFDTLWGSVGTPEVYTDYNFTVTDMTAVYLVPEPATIALLGLGALALIRKKR